MSIQSTGLGDDERLIVTPRGAAVDDERLVVSPRGAAVDDERLVVSPRGAAVMLDCGVTRVYELINSRELQSFKDGAARKITTRSIRSYIAQKLAQSGAT